MKVTQLCPTLCNPMDCSLPGSSVHGITPGQNTGVGCHALLQGIIWMQGSIPGLPHCRRIRYHLSHQRSPTKVKIFPIWLFRESFADHCSTPLCLCSHVWLFRSFPDNFSPSKPFVEVHKNQPHFPKSRHPFFLMLWNLPYHISVYPSNQSENELMLHLWYKM